MEEPSLAKLLGAFVENSDLAIINVAQELSELELIPVAQSMASLPGQPKQDSEQDTLSTFLVKDEIEELEHHSELLQKLVDHDSFLNQRRRENVFFARLKTTLTPFFKQLEANLSPSFADAALFDTPDRQEKEKGKKKEKNKRSRDNRSRNRRSGRRRGRGLDRDSAEYEQDRQDRQSRNQDSDRSSTNRQERHHESERTRNTDDVRERAIHAPDLPTSDVPRSGFRTALGAIPKVGAVATVALVAGSVLDTAQVLTDPEVTKDEKVTSVRETGVDTATIGGGALMGGAVGAAIGGGLGLMLGGVGAVPLAFAGEAVGSAVGGWLASESSVGDWINEKFGEEIDQTITTIADGASAAVDALAPLVESSWNLVKEGVGGLVDGASATVEAVTNTASGLIDGAESTLSAVSDAGKSAWSGLTETIGGIVKGMGQVAGSLAPVASTVLTGSVAGLVLDGASSLISSDLGTKVKDGVGAILESVVPAANASDYAYSGPVLTKSDVVSMPEPIPPLASASQSVSEIGKHLSEMDNLREQVKQSAIGAAATPTTEPIRTTGVQNLLPDEIPLPLAEEDLPKGELSPVEVEQQLHQLRSQKRVQIRTDPDTGEMLSRDESGNETVLPYQVYQAYRNIVQEKFNEVARKRQELFKRVAAENEARKESSDTKSTEIQSTEIQSTEIPLPAEDSAPSVVAEPPADVAEKLKELEHGNFNYQIEFDPAVRSHVKVVDGKKIPLSKEAYKKIQDYQRREFAEGSEDPIALPSPSPDGPPGPALIEPVPNVQAIKLLPLPEDLIKPTSHPYGLDALLEDARSSRNKKMERDKHEFDQSPVLSKAVPSSTRDETPVLSAESSSIPTSDHSPVLSQARSFVTYRETIADYPVAQDQNQDLPDPDTAMLPDYVRGIYQVDTVGELKALSKSGAVVAREANIDPETGTETVRTQVRAYIKGGQIVREPAVTETSTPSAHDPRFAPAVVSTKPVSLIDRYIAQETAQFQDREEQMQRDGILAPMPSITSTTAPEYKSEPEIKLEQTPVSISPQELNYPRLPEDRVSSSDIQGLGEVLREPKEEKAARSNQTTLVQGQSDPGVIQRQPSVPINFENTPIIVNDLGLLLINSGII